MRMFNMITNEDIERLSDENKKLKKRAEEAEVTIIKGIGNNSPEMKALRKENQELISKCRLAGRTMIELNLKYEANLKEIDRLAEENENLKTMLKGTGEKK